jgi:hypothetical protein
MGDLSALLVYWTWMEMVEDGSFRGAIMVEMVLRHEGCGWKSLLPLSYSDLLHEVPRYNLLLPVLITLPSFSHLST